MLALPSSATAIRQLDFGVPGAARRLRRSLLSHIIWKLHQVIANPGSKIEEARKAKRVLLSALKNSEELPHVTKAAMRFASLPDIDGRIAFPPGRLRTLDRVSAPITSHFEAGAKETLRT